MSDFYKQLQDQATHVTLTAEQKLSMKRQVLQYMEHKPVKTRASWTFFHRFAFASLLVVITIAASGTAYASHGALPGDALYAVKVHLTEPLQTTLAFSQEDKALVEADHAEERLSEADRIIVMGDKDEAIYQKLETHFAEHAAKVEKRIEALEKDGDREFALELASRFEASLSAHRKVLDRALTKEGADHSFASMAEKVKSQEQATARVRIDAETKMESKTDNSFQKVAAGKIENARKTLAEAQAYISANRANLDEEIRSQADKKIQDSINLLSEAQFAFEKQDYKSSFQIALRAERKARDAQALAKAVNKLLQQPLLLGPSVEDDGETRGANTDDGRDRDGSSRDQDSDRREHR